MNANDSTPNDSGLLLEFLYRLGQAYLASGEQTAEVERMLRRAALSYGAKSPRIVTFPTAVFLSFQDSLGEQVAIAEVPQQNLRLDQIADIYELGDQAQAGTVSAQQGVTRIQEILKQPARFGAAGAIGGHAILSVGLALVLTQSPTNLAATAGLGAIVGALKLLNRNRPSLSVHMPVVAATLVSAIVFLLIK